MLGQSTLISYHTEANGYIFFATGVHLLKALKEEKLTRHLKVGVGGENMWCTLTVNNNLPKIEDLVSIGTKVMFFVF